jgi:hypothetical protein
MSPQLTTYMLDQVVDGINRCDQKCLLLDASGYCCGPRLRYASKVSNFLPNSTQSLSLADFTQCGRFSALQI